MPRAATSVTKASPPTSPRTTTSRRAKKPPIPNGLSSSQAKRFLELLRADEIDAWEYLDNRRTNQEAVSYDQANAWMSLWALKSGYPFSLGDRSWSEHYTSEEQLYVFEHGKDKMELPDREDPIHYAETYGAFFVTHASTVSEIVAKHDRAIDWQPSRIRGFRLLSWLVDGPPLAHHEKLGLVLALAKRHVWSPESTIHLDETLLAKNGGKPWLPRDLALAIGTMEMWTDALMKLEDEHGSTRHHLYSVAIRFHRVKDIFTTMPLSEAERFLPDYDAQALADDLLALETFFRDANLGASELVRVAKGIAGKRASSPRSTSSRLVDVLCLLALEKEPTLSAADELLSFSLADDAWAERYISVLRTVSRDRRLFFLLRDLEAGADGHGGGLLAIAADPSLRMHLDDYVANGLDASSVCPAFARALARHVDMGSAFGAAPQKRVATDVLRGLSCLSLQSMLEPLADDRRQDATLFARETLFVLLRWPATHPRVKPLLAEIKLRLHLEAFKPLIVEHDDPDTLLGVLSELPASMDIPSDKPAAFELFTTLKNADIDIDPTRLSDTWSKWRREWRRSPTIE